MSLQALSVRVRRVLTRSGPLVALALALLATAESVSHAAASRASADPGKRVPPGKPPRPAKGPSLTLTERRALTITSVKAVGDESVGLVVTVTFAGDVERYLGQGGLAGALLALVVEPEPAQQQPADAVDHPEGVERPEGAVDEGGGTETVSFPFLAGRGGRATLAGATFDAFSPERVLSAIKPGRVGVVRDRSRVIFYLTGIGLSGRVGVRVESFARGALASGRRAGGRRSLAVAAWRDALTRTPRQAVAVTVNLTQLTVAQLLTLRSELAGVVSRGLEPQLRGEHRARVRLQAALDRYGELDELTAVSRGQLAADLGASKAAAAQLKRRIAGLRALIATLNGLISQTRDPPVEVVQTDARLSQEMAPQPGLVTTAIKPQGVPIIDVDPRVRYQRFSGLGAALTDSSAWLIHDVLAPPERLALLQALFGRPGLANALGVPAIHLNFLRVAIGASGAMTIGPPYSYDDMPPGQSDPSLSGFSIAHDLPYTIPTLQQALAVNPELQILATPWSPPGWMKSNDSLDNQGGQGYLLPAAYQPLADYIVKFIQAYGSYGVPIAAITPQNEPSSGQGGTVYPGLTLPAPDEAQLVAQYLAPALRAAGLPTKIYGSDLSWDSLAYAGGLTSSPAAGDLAGIAWHCYFGSPEVMSQLAQTDPALEQVVDECSPEIRPVGTPELLISSLRNWASVVAVWAVALDPSGGPVQPGNSCPGCTGPVTIDEQTQAVTLRPEYFQLGQVSAFVAPGAWRIDSQSFVTYGVDGSNYETASAGLDDVAFLNPDGSRVLVAYDNTSQPITFAVRAAGMRAGDSGDYFLYTIPSRAMATFVWR